MSGIIELTSGFAIFALDAFFVSKRGVNFGELLPLPPPLMLKPESRESYFWGFAREREMDKDKEKMNEGLSKNNHLYHATSPKIANILIASIS